MTVSDSMQEITEALFAAQPEETLYHYTSVTGVLGIIGSRVLWASDIRYMNDSAEFRHTADLVRSDVERRIAEGDSEPQLLNAFADWVRHRITNGHILFAASFRANGNLLSQWRGYSSVGKGASLGFNSTQIRRCAAEQSFRLARCVYGRDVQRHLIARIVDIVKSLPVPVDDAGSEERLYRRFEQVETDLLRIAAILKHPSFEEEQEWRLVSPVVSNYRESAVFFREGRNMLVPFLKFSLLPTVQDRIELDHVYLGPTPNISLSMNSLNMCLRKHGIRPREGIDYCDIPYRQR